MFGSFGILDSIASDLAVFVASIIAVFVSMHETLYTPLFTAGLLIRY
jgi:hypothetical protein